MTVLVKLPIEIYHGFMGRCPLSSREYAILKNSLIMLIEDGISLAHIRFW